MWKVERYDDSLSIIPRHIILINTTGGSFEEDLLARLQECSVDGDILVFPNDSVDDDDF